MPFSHHIVESCCESPKGDANNEDFLFTSPHIVAIGDGATSGDRACFADHTDGWHMKNALVGFLQKADPALTPTAFVAGATRAIRSYFGEDYYTNLSLPRSAVQLVYVNLLRGELVSVGDCLYQIRRAAGLNTVTVSGLKEVDRINYGYRAERLRALEILGALTPEAIAEVEADMWKGIQMHHVYANNAAEPLGYGVLNGTPVPEDFVTVHRLPSNCTEVILCTDGFRAPFITLAAARADLERLAAEDPHLIRQHHNHRGFRGQPWFDDTTYVRVAITR